MSKIDIFRRTTLALVFISLVSAVLHSVLYISDSPEYREWVSIQIVIQIAAAGLFLAIRRFNLYALLALIPLSVVFAHINATFLNYGSSAATYFWFAVLWLGYGVVVKRVWEQFQSPPSSTT